MRSIVQAGVFVAAMAGIALVSMQLRPVGPEPVAFRAVSVTFPADAAVYPVLGGGASSAAVMNANCLGCHSASMVMTQPRLTRAEWEGEVAKMRSVYKAPVDPGDDAVIVDWLTAMSEGLPDG